jgi:hypothetical protein
MAEKRRMPANRAPEAAAPAAHTEDGDEAERFLGRIVALGLPIASIVAAIVVGVVASVGSALLVIASGALLGTIALLWASVRTLSGDAPLPADLELLAAQHRDVDALGEQKRRVLRALKDLEAERALGKIDEADYEAIAMQYRDEAKALMRRMDADVAPSLAEAEKVARDYLAAQGLGTAAKDAAPQARGSARERVACVACATSNEPDAAFCKKCGAAMKTAAEERDATS